MTSSVETKETSANALALKVLALRCPDLQPGTPKHASLLEGLTAMCERFGTKKFALYYGLRPPVSSVEELMRDHIQGRITEAELSDRLRRDAERPIDLNMLTAFHETFEANLEHYSAILQKTVLRPSEDHPRLRAEHTREIDSHVQQLGEKLPLWREHLETVFDFLDEVRLSANLGLVQLGEFEATSVHWLAELLFKRIREAWRSCTDIDRRSRHDGRYLYEANAIDLFREQRHSSFPAPQNLSERLRHEFKLARRAIPAATTALTAASLDTALINLNADYRELDNLDRETVLIGEFTAAVGFAGHLFRRVTEFDQGIDGEIEFRDDAGAATGKRVYVQLKSGDSYLKRRKADGEEIFRAKKKRHLQYWSSQAYPVFLVIRQSTGLTRWMNVSEYIQQYGTGSLQIVFRGEVFGAQSVKNLAAAALAPVGEEKKQAVR
jgi:hypothetical protein